MLTHDDDYDAVDASTYNDHREHDDDGGQYGEFSAAEANDMSEESTNEVLAEKIAEK